MVIGDSEGVRYQPSETELERKRDRYLAELVVCADKIEAAEKRLVEAERNSALAEVELKEANRRLRSLCNHAGDVCRISYGILTGELLLDKYGALEAKGGPTQWRRKDGRWTGKA